MSSDVIEETTVTKMEDLALTDSPDTVSNASNDNDRNMIDKVNNNDIQINIKTDDGTNTDCNKEKDILNIPKTFTCSKCTLINANNGSFECEMCGHVRSDIDVFKIIHHQTWQKLIDLNEGNSSKDIPQWVACSKCMTWRIMKIPLSSILTWQPMQNYNCQNCKAPQPVPSCANYPYFELQTMTIQRLLSILKEKGFTQKAYGELQRKMNEIINKMNVNKMSKQETIIIDDGDEEDEQNDSIKEEEESANLTTWICHLCTFENTHLGNLCAMCDQPKQGSFASKMSDAEYAKIVQLSSPKAQSPSPELTQTNIVQKSNMDNLTTYHGLPADAQIGPFGYITCLKDGVRLYLIRKNSVNQFAELQWTQHVPKHAQQWVESVFPKSIYLPKMDENELKFVQNNIDLTQENNEDQRTNDLFESNLKPKYVDFEERARKNKSNHSNYGAFFNNNGGDEDVIPFDFSYEGMNGYDDEKEEHKLGDTVEEELGSLMNRALKQDDIEPLSVDPKGMNITLFPHQKKGVAWMNHMELERTNGGFLCDQMGVGKTIQIIALMLKSRQDAIAEKRRKYNEENGYLSSSDEETMSDSQDEKCGGFVVSDDEPMDFESDNNEKFSDGDEEWKPNQKNEKSRKRKRKYDDLDSDDLSEDLCANRPLKKAKKRRKLNDGKLSVYNAWHDEHYGKNKKFSVRQRTLIVGPLAIIDQWADEIANRAPSQFKVAVYHGPGRKRKFDKRKLKEYDVVITTYGHVSSEFAKGNEEKQSGLFRLNRGFFHRIVLDEAHTIKNSNSWQSKACADIGNRDVKVRWALTGTPIQNEVMDLFALSRFLQIPYSAKKRDFKTRLKIFGKDKTNVSGRTKQAITAFLAAHMLRRLKSEVVDDLVSKTEEVIEIKMDDAESAVYEAFQNHARTRFNKFVKAGTAKKNYAHILVLLLRLRQITDHPYLAMKINDGQSEVLGEDDNGNKSENESDSDNDNDNEDVMSKVNKSVIKRLNEMKDSILDSECPICLDIFSDGVMFRNCGHLICSEHLFDLNEQCMLCRKPFKANKVIKFADIIRSDLINEHHKKSMLADGGQNGLIMDGEVIANKMSANSNNNDYMLQRKVIWRKITRAKGIFRSNEQIKIDEENANKPKKKESTDEKLSKLQKKFDWRTYSVQDEVFECEFKDDDENGYKECDKYPNEEIGWKFIPSSKTKMVIQKVRSIRSQKPNDKIIIFSQFTTMLSVMERVMNKYGINYLMYDGSKTRQQRREIIDAFKADKDENDIPVILMSLKCAALGLNLTVANHVIFCDLWWNPATESQAIDRVHRIGQTKHVYITRIVIKDSVEERILDLQRRKQNIADSALDGANFAKQNKLSIADLGRLFGADKHIIDMAEGRNSGFNRDSLMNNNRRRRQSMVQMNHHNHNHNHQHLDRSYVNSLDAGTLRLLQEMGEIPRA